MYLVLFPGRPSQEGGREPGNKATKLLAMPVLQLHGIDPTLCLGEQCTFIGMGFEVLLNQSYDSLVLLATPCSVIVLVILSADNMLGGKLTKPQVAALSVFRR